MDLVTPFTLAISPFYKIAIAYDQKCGCLVEPSEMCTLQGKRVLRKS